MIQGSATLVIDLGNSSTKGKVLFGKDSQSGKFRTREFEIPNVFALIDEDYEVSSDYSDATSTILKVDTTINDRPIIGCFCNGLLQMKEKPLCVIKPSATSKKYDLDSTVLSYRLALLFAYKAIMAMNRTNDYSQLDITWKIVTLLPPGDVSIGKEPLTNIIKNITSIDAVFPKVSIPVKISSVTVLPEGYCAYVACVYDVCHTFRPDYKFLTDEIVIVFDIGAGTTDILVIEGNKLVQNSKYTIEQGGNNVHKLVKRELRAKGIALSDEAISEGIINGTVKDGAKVVDIVDIINNANAEVAQKLVSETQDFFELTDIKARSIGYVLVCGGGSIKSDVNTNIIPISKKVIEQFKATLSPNSELITIPKHLVTKEDAEGSPYSIEEEISPRKLNLIGASILAEVL